MKRILESAIFLMATATAMVPTISFAGGSVDRDEVMAVLQSQPELFAFISSTLECYRGGRAEVRVGWMYPLAGKRLGPYVLWCRPKGTKDNYDFEVRVNTFFTFFNDDGKEVDVSQATRVTEKATSIELIYDACKQDWCKAP